MRYVIPQELVNALIQYLASRPYAEVAPAIQALQALSPLPESDVVSSS